MISTAISDCTAFELTGKEKTEAIEEKPTRFRRTFLALFALIEEVALAAVTQAEIQTFAAAPTHIAGVTIILH